MHTTTKTEIRKIYHRINRHSQLNRVVRVNMDTITTSVQRVREYTRKQLRVPSKR